jgi:hypothetical protein
MLLEHLADIEKLDPKDQEMTVELIHSVLARRSIEATALPAAGTKSSSRRVPSAAESNVDVEVAAIDDDAARAATRRA